MDFPVTILRPNCPAIFASPSGDGAVISNVQAWSTVASGVGVSLTKDFALAPTAGNLIIAFVECDKSKTITSVADSVGSFNLLGPFFSTNNLCNIYLAWRQVTGAPGVTITATPSASCLVAMSVAEYSPASAGTFAQDGSTVGQSDITSTTPNAGSITVTAGNSLIVGGTVARAPLAAGTDGGGHAYTQERTYLLYDSESIIDFFGIAPGTYNPTWTSASAQWCAIGAAFKCT